MKRARVVHERASEAVQSTRSDAGDVKHDRTRDSSTVAGGKAMPPIAEGGTAECYSPPGGDVNDRAMPERSAGFGDCTAEDMEMQMVDKLLDEAIGSSLSVRIGTRQRKDGQEKEEGAGSNGGNAGACVCSARCARCRAPPPYG